MEMRSPPDVPPHSSSLPNREDHSSSTQVESNELSQADSESIPADGPKEYTSKGDEILSQRTLRSEHWPSFQRIKLKTTGAYEARCLYCKKKLVGDPKSGTTHLGDHLKSCFKKKLVDGKQKILTPSLMAGEGKKGNLEIYSFDQEIARKQLAYMIIMQEYPLRMVEHVWFRKFCFALQPAFKVVSRNTIKSDILKIYDVEKGKTMRLMERNRSRISLTTDMWTASNQKRGFMVITTHFIDDSWKLQSRILRFVYVPCPHTVEVMCEVLMETILEWNIDRKLSTLTVDNCTSNDAMISLLLEKFDGEHMWVKGFFHVRCAAHIINLIVKDGLDVIKSSIEKVRDSVAYWTATPKREEQFVEAARQLGIDYDRKLALDCPTRWNSTFLMLQTAIEYRSAFARLKLKHRQYKCCPNDDDWYLAQDICERLEIFYRVTLLFSGTSYPTSNLFFLDVCDIKLTLTEWACCGIDLVEEMANKMIEKYDKYWDNTHGFLGVAVVLDPRFKMTLIGYYYKKIYGEKLGEEMAEEVRAHCFDLLTLYEGKTNNNKKRFEVTRSSNQPTTYLKCKDCLSDFDSYRDNLKKAKTSHVKSELEHYLEEEELPRLEGVHFDILTWWNSNGLKYPTLQAIARDVLAVPVSTVASESSFSTGGRVVTSSRNRLHPKTLEALMCTQSWLAAFEDGAIPTINDEDMDVDDECMSGVTHIVDIDD